MNTFKITLLLDTWSEDPVWLLKVYAINLRVGENPEINPYVDMNKEQKQDDIRKRLAEAKLFPLSQVEFLSDGRITNH